MSLVSCGRTLQISVDLWMAASWGMSTVTGLWALDISINNLDEDIDDILTVCTNVTRLGDSKLCQMKD
jgi:hypothetical protein